MFLPTKTSDSLNLSWITPQIIVSAGPSENAPPHKPSAAQVRKYLDKYPSWWVWNFKQESSDYSDSVFGGRVTRYPFPDHNPPPFHFFLCVREIAAFLACPGAVAFLHCNAGKGRSGSMAVAYLVYTGVPLEKALEKFTSQRMKAYAGPGISIYSQRRYLEYWENIQVEKSEIAPNTCTYSTIDLYKRTPFRILHISLEGARKECVFEIHTYSTDGSLTRVNSGDFLFGDIRISFGWCYFWFVPLFHNGPFRLAWEEIDGLKGTQLKGRRAFDVIEVEFERK